VKSDRDFQITIAIRIAIKNFSGKTGDRFSDQNRWRFFLAGILIPANESCIRSSRISKDRNEKNLEQVHQTEVHASSRKRFVTTETRRGAPSGAAGVHHNRGHGGLNPHN
jgi:hypothetical protein